MTRNKVGAQAGIAHIALVAVILLVVGAGVATFFLVRSENDSLKTTEQNIETEMGKKESNSTTLQVNQRNTARKNDASSLLAGVSEYQATNTGNLPTQYKDRQLSGGTGTTPSAVQLETYTAVDFAKGEQLPVTSTSQIRLVTQAGCGSGGTTVASSSSRSVVVQFALEKTSGNGHTSECKTL